MGKPMSNLGHPHQYWIDTMKELPRHAEFIKAQLPDWLKKASTSLRNTLRGSLIKCNQSRHDVKALLADLQSPEDFAHSLLKRAAHTELAGLLNVDHSVLVREWKTHHLLGLIRIHATTTEQSPVEAALQNFEPAEAEEDGMETGSALYSLSAAGRIRIPISAIFFAQLCRSLDVGGHYLQHLDRVLATDNAVTLLATHDANHFEAALHEARMKYELSERLYSSLLELHREGKHPDLLCEHLTIDGVILPTVLVIRDRQIDRDQVLYTPNDPTRTFRRHASMQELESQLATRLMNPDYLAFFKRLLPRQARSDLLTIKPARTYLIPLDRVEQTFPISLESSVTRTAISTSVFQAMARQRIARIKGDARCIAVPTAEANLASRQTRLHELKQAGVSFLMFAASFVPVVGEGLLAITAAQLVNSVYSGFAAWSRDESNEALNDLLDVADNAALAVGTAGAVKTAGFTANLMKVQLSTGGQRLWNPDLSPYDTPTPLPDSLPADAQGLYELGQQHFVKLDGLTHAVKPDSTRQRWQVQHPSDPQAYTPTLLSNGVGGWRGAHESTRQWDNLKLIKRMGPDASNINATTAEAVLLVGGVDSNTLRQAHQQSLRPPPLLRDTLKHFNLLEEITAFDETRAEGRHVTALSSLIQFHLVCALPEWPTQRGLEIVDERHRTVLSHGQTGTPISVPLARFRQGDLLHCLEDLLTVSEYNALLPQPVQAHLSKVENLALRLSREAKVHATRVFNWLMARNEQTMTPPEKDLHLLAPSLSKNHLEEMAAVLSPEQAARLRLEKSLTVQQQWELRHYLYQADIARAREGIFFDSACGEDSLTLMISTLEQLPGWPASIRVEVRDASASGPLLYKAGTDSAESCHVVIRDRGRYQARDSQGNALPATADLFDAIADALHPFDLQLLLRRSDCESLKQAVRRTSLRLMARAFIPPRARGQLSAGTAQAERLFDPLFAVTTAPQDLTLRADGVYQARPGADGNYRYYIVENARHYEVKRDALGWRLLDTRSRFRAYQPYVVRRSDASWRIDPLKGALLGGMPDRPQSHATDIDSSDTFETASGSSTFESAEESLPITPYTPAELRHMRTQRSYQHSQNYRRIYDRANNGRYPLRDVDGSPLRVTIIHGDGQPQVSSTPYNKDLLTPYLSWEGYEKVAQLYEDKLEVRPFTALDMRYVQESSLIDQATVVTRRSLKKGECLGIYGGELIPRPVAHFRNDPYLMDICPTVAQATTSTRISNREVLLSGDNILSRINTLFEYEGNLPARQARSGYNTELVFFDVTVQKGSQAPERLRLTALALLEDLVAGTELRWDYGYDEATIRGLFAPTQIGV